MNTRLLLLIPILALAGGLGAQTFPTPSAYAVQKDATTGVLTGNLNLSTTRTLTLGDVTLDGTDGWLNFTGSGELYYEGAEAISLEEHRLAGDWATDGEMSAASINVTDTAGLASQLGVEGLAATYMPRDWLASDGVTTNRCAYVALGSAGNIAGSNLTEVIPVIVPTSNPSANAVLFAYSSTFSAAPSATAWTLFGAIDTSGNLVIEQTGATPATDYRTYTVSGFRSSYSGRSGLITVVFTGASTTAPIVYWNGTVLSGTSADGSGTDPNWVSASTVATYRLSGYNWPSGKFAVGIPINRAWTQSNITDYLSTAGLSLADAVSGSMVDPSTTSFANRTAASGDYGITGNGYEILSGASATGFTAGHGAGAISQCTKAGYSIKAGSRWRVRFNFSLAEGIKPTSIGLTNSGSSSGANASANLNSSLVVGDNDFTVVATADASGFTFYHSNTEVQSTFTITSFSMVPLGAVIQPAVQPILVIDDVGPNHLYGVLAAGVTPITQKRTWRVGGTTSTSGNQQLLGASVFGDYTRNAFDSIEVNGTSTATVYVGSTSGGSGYSASASLLSGRNYRTLATHYPTTNNIWVNSSTTDSLKWTILGHLID